MAHEDALSTLRETWDEPFETGDPPLPPELKKLSNQFDDLLAKQGVTNELLLELIEVLKTKKPSAAISRPGGGHAEFDRWVNKRIQNRGYCRDC